MVAHVSVYDDTYDDLYALTKVERGVTVPAEDRTVEIKAEDRTVVVPVEDRTVTA